MSSYSSLASNSFLNDELSSNSGYESFNDAVDNFLPNDETDGMTDGMTNEMTNEMTEEQYEQFYPTFDSQSEYLFVNKCLTLMHGPLPSYAYYQSNDDVKHFWDDLEDDYYPMIYNYLIENDFLDEEFIDTQNLDATDIEDIYYMRNAVYEFVCTYFENRLN